MSQNYSLPWCSSVHGRKPRKLSYRESFYPSRENNCDYHYKEITKTKYPKRGKVIPIFVAFVIGLSLLYYYRGSFTIEKVENILTQAQLLSFSQHESVNEECCYRMQRLTMKLIHMENLLRTTQRMRRTMISQNYGTENNALEYIVGAQAVKGRSTIEWGGRVALWGVIPLWRAAPPPDTILALRKPTPSDCWPFSGSTGEVIIEVPQYAQVHSISVEHIRPDTAQSAPKDFIVYGILENGTWTKATDGTYRYNKPAKQYYSLDNSAPLKRIVFRVLSNHGNQQYTCVYRVHLYSEPNTYF